MHCFKCNNYVWINISRFTLLCNCILIPAGITDTLTPCVKQQCWNWESLWLTVIPPTQELKKKKKKNSKTPLPRYEIVMPQVWNSSAIDKTVSNEGKFKCLKCHKTGFGVIFQTFRIWMFILNWSWAAFFLQTRPMESFNFYSHFLSYTYVKIIKE